jgi:AhpD family alkylhydroperoxidase
MIIMQPRLDAAKVAPAALKAMQALEMQTRTIAGLETSLLELVRMRASQINGCAYCLDMHSKDARAHGESEQRLYALNAWRETPFFTDRERAALDWTEALTLISQTHAPDSVYEKLRELFTDEEIVQLTLAIVTINGWNRVATGFRAVPGSYQPAAQKSA